MVFIRTILSILIICNQAYSKPIELKSKQALNYVRYLSTDGKISYYQTRKGQLVYSSFFNTKNILNLGELTQYEVSVSNDYVLIQTNQNFHTMSALEQPNDIYISKIGQEPVYIGKGYFPKVHGKFKTVTYLNNNKDKINVYSIKSKKNIKKIKLRTDKANFKQIEVLMFSRNDIIYSDYNSKNEKAYIYLSLIDESSKLVFKVNSSLYKLEACIIGKDLIVGQFPLSSLSLGTEIIKIALYHNKNFSTFDQIYTSELSDRGSLVCKDNNIYFIKNFKKNETLQSSESDAYRINLKTKKSKRLSNLKSISSVFKMDDLILSNFRGKYFILDGSQIMDDKIKRDKK